MGTKAWPNEPVPPVIRMEEFLSIFIVLAFEEEELPVKPGSFDGTG